jgi:hypothetical protein
MSNYFLAYWKFSGKDVGWGVQAPPVRSGIISYHLHSELYVCLCVSCM